MNSIYAYFDEWGSLKERVSAPVRANGSARVYAYCKAFDSEDSFGVATIRYAILTSEGVRWVESKDETGKGFKALPLNYVGKRDLRFFSPTESYYMVWFDVPQAVIDAPGTWKAIVTYRTTDGEATPMGALTFEIEGDVQVGESITLDQYNYLLGQVKLDDVAGKQARTVAIRTTLTNVSGYSLVGYATTEISTDTEDGVKIVTSAGKNLTESQAKGYLQAMTGSDYLPYYQKDKPSYVYLVDGNGQAYAARYDDENGLVLWKLEQLLTTASVTQTVEDTADSVPSGAAVTAALAEGLEGTTNYLSLDLTEAQQKQIEENGIAYVNCHKYWNGELAVYFWDEFAIYLQNGIQTEDGTPIYEGDIPTETANTHGWTGHIKVVWNGTMLEITKEPPWHEPMSEETIEEVLS